MSPDIMLGYAFNAGGKWTGGYLVLDLEIFSSLSGSDHAGHIAIQETVEM